VFRFITSKSIWVNILVGLLLLCLLVLIFLGLLDWITAHGKYQKVPSVIGQNVDAAKLNLTSKGFTVEITDSVYDNAVGALSVVRQSPEADAMVKEGRTIYLSINRAVAPMVEMPNMVGFSIRSAGMYLLSLGLKLGDTSYRPDIARNAVLQQLYNGQDIKAGTKIPLGSVISFVLGSGIGSGEIAVPDLVGLTLSQARAQLTMLNLNIGSVVPVESVKDTSAAFIVRQEPPLTSEPVPGQKIINRLHAGQTIDVYIGNTAPLKDTAQSNLSNQ
jgi:beta-lactam-binding protein with PASTA domain